jgi:hypothetical protein
MPACEIKVTSCTVLGLDSLSTLPKCFLLVRWLHMHWPLGVTSCCESKRPKAGCLSKSIVEKPHCAFCALLCSLVSLCGLACRICCSEHKVCSSDQNSCALCNSSGRLVHYRLCKRFSDYDYFISMCSWRHRSRAKPAKWCTTRLTCLTAVRLTPWPRRSWKSTVVSTFW